MRIAVVGASGYVGSRLVDRLVGLGHEVVAIARSRRAAGAASRVEARQVDVGDRDAVAGALRGCDVAYYLVHSLGGGGNFGERDRRLAASFRSAAEAAGVGRIVYLGGLGAGDLSAHLASRQEVGAVLAAGSVPVVELRAAVVLGSGSVSFEMLRYLTERLPAMVCPRWIRTRLQPIAERDLLRYLIGSAEPAIPAGVYEVAGPEVTTYRAMIDAYARVRGLRRRRILDVSVLTPSLSAHWVDLVAPLDRSTTHSLIDSLATEVIAPDWRRSAELFGIEPVGVDRALTDALADQADAMAAVIFDAPTGVHEGVYAMHEHADVASNDVEAVSDGLEECGGDLGWYGLAAAWRLRILIGRPFGERLRLHRPTILSVGARVDWWTVAAEGPGMLVLRTDEWFCGEAWLAYRVERGASPRVVQVGALRTRGLLGVVYWRLVWPIHLVVFEVMAKRQATVKKSAARTT
jgi:uncharacterized protein YbjT (DUF2867 family)